MRCAEKESAITPASPSNQAEGLEKQQTSLAQHVSTIGSVTGTVKLDAGRDVDIQGAQLQADQDIDIAGRNVNVMAVVDMLDSHTLSYKEISGLRIGAKSNVTDAVAALKKLADRGQEVDDPRLKALYAAKAAYAAKDLAQMVQTMQQSGSKGGASGRVSIGLGYSRQESESVAHADTVRKASAATSPSRPGATARRTRAIST